MFILNINAIQTIENDLFLNENAIRNIENIYFKTKIAYYEKQV